MFFALLRQFTSITHLSTGVNSHTRTHTHSYTHTHTHTLTVTAQYNAQKQKARDQKVHFVKLSKYRLYTVYCHSCQNHQGTYQPLIPHLKVKASVVNYSDSSQIISQSGINSELTQSAVNEWRLTKLLLSKKNRKHLGRLWLSNESPVKVATKPGSIFPSISNGTITVIQLQLVESRSTTWQSSRKSHNSTMWHDMETTPLTHNPGVFILGSQRHPHHSHHPHHHRHHHHHSSSLIQFEHCVIGDELFTKSRDLQHNRCVVGTFAPCMFNSMRTWVPITTVHCSCSHGLGRRWPYTLGTSTAEWLTELLTWFTRTFEFRLRWKDSQLHQRRTQW